jgi:hypothetical protein
MSDGPENEEEESKVMNFFSRLNPFKKEEVIPEVKTVSEGWE